MSNLIGMKEKEIAGAISPYIDTKFRPSQIYHWLYHRGVSTFDEMTNISKTQRELLAENFTIDLPKIETTAKSDDSSIKYLFRLGDSLHVETVLMDEGDHFTFCLSTQVGCRLGCLFCATGSGGFVRDMNAAEIVGTFLVMKKELPEDAVINVVFMGMGEPLQNLEALFKSIELISDSAGPGVPHKRITVSTAGISGRLKKLNQKFPKIGIAFSLNAVDEATRTRLMPVNKKNPLGDIIEELEQLKFDRQNRLTLEYVLINNVNDNAPDASRLASIANRLNAKVNIIPFNPVEGTEFTSPSDPKINDFTGVLARSNVTVMVRRSKGKSVSAACGQLRIKHGVK